MPTPLRLTIGRILALALVASLFVSPVASAAPASPAPEAAPFVSAAALAPGNVQTDLPLQDIASIGGGGLHVCSITNSGGLKCWGWNAYGQLGDGTTESTVLRPFPVDVSGLSSGVAQVVGGGCHTCALTTGGGVKCWGMNSYGQVGDGTTSDAPHLTPVDVVGLGSGVKFLAAPTSGDDGTAFAGGSHTCALTGAGGVKCWGVNYFGQLGDGTTTNRLTPVDVIGLEAGVKTLAAGTAHVCAVVDTGEVKCWGWNDSGQLGDGTKSQHEEPVKVVGLGGVVAVAAGGSHTCALTNAGGVKCWGQGGSVGDGTTEVRLTPVDVVGLGSGVKALAAGIGHTCAITDAGAVKCWGRGFSGELGNGSSGAGADRTVPVDVVGLGGGVTALALGGGGGMAHSCALTDAGTVKCWGSNAAGELGVSWTNPHTLPADVPGLDSGVAMLTGGAGHTCALIGGALKCWGFNTSGQVGDGSTTYRNTPTDVTGLSSGIAMVSAGADYTCVVTQAGGAKCWGGNNQCQLGDGTQGTNRKTPVNVTGLSSSVTTIAASQLTHTCALTTTGGVKCWGVNLYGQVGDGTKTMRKTPVDVVGLTSGVAALSAGIYHTCALTATGGVKCWGHNASGQLGDGTHTDRTSPVDVLGLTSGVKAIATEGDAACALTDAGGVKCWGGDMYNLYGSTPRDVPGLTSGVKALAGGRYHACALTTGGGVKCWGANRSGQLGDGTITNRPAPVDVIGLTSGATALAAGMYHTCALVSDAKPRCWGNDGSHIYEWYEYWSSATPVDVIGAQTPVVTANYVSGKPGSLFTLNGGGFPVSTPIAITVNGTALTTTAATTPGGRFILFLDMTGADAGFYEVAVTAGGTASTVLALHPDAPLRVQEGGGTTLVVPAGIGIPANTLFLPRLR